ncbi:ComEA family DNA-binding protein [Clostridium drakei]|uniref:Helix-hairpin-helix domain-containing protein n=1 Tax=Clostridium drakei TaxID=332101 RepID=A0A2U8DQ83_9CLOT|nr:helix-hairpin-helix domain-containing protein [Clostridium drakei]AWI04595.1 hypothetical protein B9W14_08850 [Clostridium drakei]
MSSISQRKKWEIINSLWILPTFTLGFFNWISFFYIGYKVKCKKWIFCGLIYSIPFITVMTFGKATTFIAVLTLILGIVGIAHAFTIRTEYLIRLESIYGGKILSDSQVKEIIVKDKLSKVNLEDNNVFQSTNENIAVKLSFSFEEDTKSKDRGESHTEAKQFTNENLRSEPIDINTASENELSTLPGIGIILAKKAVNHREAKGYFNSVDEFAEILSLKPHILERVKPLIVVSKVENKTDKSSNKSGRIIDF